MVGYYQHQSPPIINTTTSPSFVGYYQHHSPPIINTTTSPSMVGYYQHHSPPIINTTTSPSLVGYYQHHFPSIINTILHQSSTPPPSQESEDPGWFMDGCTTKEGSGGALSVHRQNL
ncbi:hypothetical protein Pcinc_001830 [Petrolisthes cinctipes]|uniref:Uncharacterized protein n=1 Tax=Petrolisthes cinctipes TaxID=88211 RepID=A0AAE1L2R8_PETCI|nr:hypothetical protein Pcinc_001830 [Petrolisthes cinctipes]